MLAPTHRKGSPPSQAGACSREAEAATWAVDPIPQGVLMSAREKAEQFAALHVRGRPLVLCNAWDAGSARAVADAGASAIATSSWSVAAAQGYADGEKLPLDVALQVYERIAMATRLPLTVDFESGYATEPERVAEHLGGLLDIGVAGINFEDRAAAGGLHAIAQQQARLRAIRARADAAGLPLFVNARTDLFLQSPAAEHAGLLPAAIERAAAYAEAGASGFFVPGLVAEELIAELCAGVALPVNVMVMPMLPSAARLAQLGVARISHGPAPYLRVMEALRGYAADCCAVAG
ncbi:isocitrate lyase/phosphoenolpyruvate mutase family protein [Fulvimonas yonginensis]|uniref:Isocitrate lyase/phosphoenolpyruvate mutase family protein n=1 Tax=Fulvimonas yonginensis TaxID=1495200 RepID=A0ABU8JFJ6_9GAMM